MLGFSEEIAIKVWKGTDDGVKAEALVNDLHITSHTVERLREVRKGFTEDKADSELVTKAWNLGSIKTLHSWWQDYQISKNPELHRSHIRRLIKLASEIRQLITNPEMTRHFDISNSVWKWGGQDWHFNPNSWCCMMTTYLEDEELLNRHFPGFQYLKKHLENSPFWSDYTDLLNTAGKLDTDIEVAIKESGIRNVKDYRKWLGEFPYNRTCSPLNKTKEKELDPPLDSEAIDLFEKKFQVLKKFVPEYQQRLDKLENILQKLWDDFDPEEIEPEIELGRCPKCFSDIAYDVKE